MLYYYNSHRRENQKMKPDTQVLAPMGDGRKEEGPYVVGTGNK